MEEPYYLENFQCVLRDVRERWLAIFNRAGLEARVAWVEYVDD